MTRFGQKATAPIGDKGLVADLALDSGVECRVHLDNELNLSSPLGPLLTRTACPEIAGLSSAATLAPCGLAVSEL